MGFREELDRISERIRVLRKEKGYTVQELAYRCDIERSNLSRIESGRSNITLKTLCLICDALEVDLTELMGKEPLDEEPDGEGRGRDREKIGKEEPISV